jgi:hypothetical protein
MNKQGPDDYLATHTLREMLALAEPGLRPLPVKPKTIAPSNGSSQKEADQEAPAAPAAPVDGADLVRDLEAFFTKYVVLPAGAALTIALWVLASWIINAFDAFAYLVASSPQKRCGKTRVLRLLSMVCREPLASANISVAATFRLVEAKKPSLLSDEAQMFRDRTDRSSELHDLYAAAFEQDTAVCHRMGGARGDEPKTFHVYSPKALTLIGRLTDILEDRSLEIRMRRRKKTEPVARFRVRQVKEEAKPLFDRISRFAAQAAIEIEQAYLKTTFAEWLEDRDEQRWAPLLSTLQVADPSRLREALQIVRVDCRYHARDEDDEKNAAVRLLRDIQTIYGQHTADDDPLKDGLFSKELVAALVEIDDAPWKTWKRDRDPMDTRDLAKLLKLFEIEPRDIWRTVKGADGAESQSDHTKGYKRSFFVDVWERYLSSGPSEEEPTDSQEAPEDEEPPAGGTFPEEGSGGSQGTGGTSSEPSRSCPGSSGASLSAMPREPMRNKADRAIFDPRGDPSLADAESSASPSKIWGSRTIADPNTKKSPRTKLEDVGGVRDPHPAGPHDVQVLSDSGIVLGLAKEAGWPSSETIGLYARIGGGEDAWRAAVEKATPSALAEFGRRLVALRVEVAQAIQTTAEAVPPPAPNATRVSYLPPAPSDPLPVPDSQLALAQGDPAGQEVAGSPGPGWWLALRSSDPDDAQ